MWWQESRTKFPLSIFQPSACPCDFWNVFLKFSRLQQEMVTCNNECPHEAPFSHSATSFSIQEGTGRHFFFRSLLFQRSLQHTYMPSDVHDLKGWAYQGRDIWNKSPCMIGPLVPVQPPLCSSCISLYTLQDIYLVGLVLAWIPSSAWNMANCLDQTYC